MPFFLAASGRVISEQPVAEPGEEDDFRGAECQREHQARCHNPGRPVAELLRLRVEVEAMVVVVLGDVGAAENRENWGVFVHVGSPEPEFHDSHHERNGKAAM
jgi:hypothetical protein